MNFPSNILPNSGLIQAASERQNFPAEITAAGTLAAISYALGNALRFRNPAGYESKCNVWIAVVAPRGTGKTHAIERCLLPITDHVKAKFRDHEKEMEIYEDSGREGKAPQFVPPINHDTTIEGLHKSLNHNPHGVITHADELTGFIGNFGRYSGGNDAAGYNSLYNANGFSVNRKNTGLSVFLPDPFWSLIGGIQPTLLQKSFNGDAVESGFFDRISFVFPRDLDYKIFTGELDENLWRGYDQGLSRLLDFSMKETESYVRSENPEKWLNIYHSFGVVRNSMAATDPQRGLYAKAQTMFCRWCLIAHGLNVAFSGKEFLENITEEESKFAYALTTYFIQTGLKAYEITTNSSPVDTLPEDKKHLYELLPDGPFERKNMTQIAEQGNIRISTPSLDRFLKNRDFFKKSAYGEYSKIY